MNEKLNSLLGDFIDFSAYQQMLLQVPVSTVDFVVTRVVDGEKSFLLIKRAEGAFVGDWFVLGGRQKRGEAILEALHRIAKREVGLSSEQILNTQFSHCQDVFNPEGENSEGELPAWHSVLHFHIIAAVDDFEPKLDATSTGFGWFTLETIPKVPEAIYTCLTTARHFLL